MVSLEANIGQLAWDYDWSVWEPGGLPLVTLGAWRDAIGHFGSHVIGQQACMLTRWPWVQFCLWAKIKTLIYLHSQVNPALNQYWGKGPGKMKVAIVVLTISPTSANCL